MLVAWDNLFFLLTYFKKNKSNQINKKLEKWFQKEKEQIRKEERAIERGQQNAIESLRKTERDLEFNKNFTLDSQALKEEDLYKQIVTQIEEQALSQNQYLKSESSDQGNENNIVVIDNYEDQDQKSSQRS